MRNEEEFGYLRSQIGTSSCLDNSVKTGREEMCGTFKVAICDLERGRRRLDTPATEWQPSQDTTR